MTATARPVGARLERARQLAELGRLDEAVPLVHQVLAEHPDLVPALHLLAYCHLRADRYADALAVAQRAAAAAPDDPTSHRQIARALTGLGRPRQGLPAAVRARELDPHDHRNELVLADTLLEAGGTANILAALDAARRACRLAPQEPGAHVYVGHAQRRMAEFGRARAAYRQALALAPDDPMTLYSLAALDADRGRALAASPLVGETVRAAPTDPVAVYTAWRSARRALWLLTDVACVPLLVVAGFVGAWRDSHPGPAGVAVGLLAGLAGVAAVAGWLRWRLGRLSAPTRTLIRANLRRFTFAVGALRNLSMALAILLLAADPSPGPRSAVEPVAAFLLVWPVPLLLLRVRNWLAAELYYVVRRLWFRLRGALRRSPAE